MMRRVDGERPILGTERVEPKIDPSEEGGEALWASGPKKGLKRPDGGFGVWWKGCRKQLPSAPFPVAFSQVHRYTWLKLRRVGEG